MSAWWDRSTAPPLPGTREDGRPILLPGGRKRLLAELNARIAAFVPEWRNLSDEDAGVALVRLFGEQLAAVLANVERLPDKALIEFLSSAGIGLLPPRPAQVSLAFEAAPTAAGGVTVPEGFQVSSPAADGSSDDVVWETLRTLTVSAAKLAEAHAFDGLAGERIALDAPPILPFGFKPGPRAALWLGLQAKQPLGRNLSFGVEVAASVPTASVSFGGAPSPLVPRPVLRWEALTAAGFEPAQIARDDTEGLTRSGVIELALPGGLTLDRPVETGTGPALHWLRLRVAHGGFAQPPRLGAVRLNVVPATAARTIRDEVPTPVGGPGPKRMRLSQTPVLPGSLILAVDEGGRPTDLFSFDDAQPSADGFRQWHEVATLAGQLPDARVFTLDPVAGIIQFGDDRNGMRPPDGNRNVVARSYRVASGRAGAVEAGRVAKMLRTLPQLAKVTNPLPAKGGVDAESVESAVARGPRWIQARGRAVTPDDVALLARAAPEADVVRAFALPSIDPTEPGARAPGVIAVFVVPSRRPGDQSAGPPVADADTLQAVARHIARDVGPLGARVIAARPRFHRVRVETTIALDPAADAGAVAAQVRAALDAYLDPYVGGDARTGWPLGEPLRHARLVRRVLDANPAVLSVPFLNVVVDGLRAPACADVPLSVSGLTWPDGHEIVPLFEGAAA